MNVQGPFDMGVFVTKVVKEEVSPTLLLLEWKLGFVVGGFAGVPWPKNEGFVFASDPKKESFIFSLEPAVQRFDLLKPEKALMRDTNGRWRSFDFGGDLTVYSHGTWAAARGTYSGERDNGCFPRFPVPFSRFELWGL
jgi:hypothetical protein